MFSTQPGQITPGDACCEESNSKSSHVQLLLACIGRDCFNYTPYPSRVCLPTLILAEGGEREEFSSWCVQHGRVYTSEAEEMKAFEAYLFNRALVQELNRANRCATKW